jgi:hypothetical protein
MVAQSGSEVNQMLDRHRVQPLPAMGGGAPVFAGFAVPA